MELHGVLPPDGMRRSFSAALRSSGSRLVGLVGLIGLVGLVGLVELPVIGLVGLVELVGLSALHRISSGYPRDLRAVIRKTLNTKP